MIRRTFLLSGLAATGITSRTLAQASPAQLEVYNSPTCGCCSAWVSHMRDAGLDVIAHDIDRDSLWALKERSGIKPEHSSCHTAFVDGYFVEGHVPAPDIHRLLAERPDAHGLAVPGMPIGSPGMEMGNTRDPYETLLVLRKGATEVFQRH